MATIATAAANDAAAAYQRLRGHLARPLVFCHAIFPYRPFGLWSGIRSRDNLLSSLPALRAI
jgi:hypothetical protein